MYEIFKAGTLHSTHATLGEVLWRLNDRRSPDPIPGSPLEQIQVKLVEVAQPVPLRRQHNHIAPVLDGLGDPRDLLVRMLDELMPYARTPAGAIKKPYQMLRGHWGAIRVVLEVGLGVMSCFSDVNQTRVGDFSQFTYEECKRRFGYGPSGPSYDDAGQVNCRHDVHVAYALARGNAVPEAVTNDYLQNPDLLATDMHWFEKLLRQEHLRGRFRSVDQLTTTLGLLGQQTVTEESLPGLLRALSSLPDGASYIAIDNALYAGGFLQLLAAAPLPDPESLGRPYNDFAGRLHAELVRFKSKREVKRLAEEAGKGRVTQRDIDQRQRAIASLGQRESYGWANKVAEAIATRDLRFMLQVLCDNNNEASQRTVEAEFGIKLRSLRAAERRRAVFGLAGAKTDEEYRQAERDLADQQVQREAAADKANAPKRLAELKSAAAYRRIRFEGEVMTADVFVEKLIAKGLTEVVSRPRGASKRYFLLNKNGAGYAVTAKDGTLPYAQALLAAAASQEKAEAVEAEES